MNKLTVFTILGLLITYIGFSLLSSADYLSSILMSLLISSFGLGCLIISMQETENNVKEGKL